MQTLQELDIFPVLGLNKNLIFAILNRTSFTQKVNKDVSSALILWKPSSIQKDKLSDEP